MSSKDWHPYTKYLIVLAVLGTAAFLFLGVGSGTDYWTTVTHTNTTGRTYLESHNGLWRNCYHPDTVPADSGMECKTFNFTNIPEKGSPGYDYKLTMYALRLSAIVSVIFGLILVFLGDILALCTTRIHKRPWFIAAGTFFLFGGFFVLAGLCLYITMATHHIKWWPSELGSPPNWTYNFSWSFALMWVGLTFSMLTGGTFVWLTRLYVEDML
ncbi:transmembrane protein 235-like [Saccoglossus kowalevskii]|uniref:Transmembrane protein 114-like n=1 Tax=Saccoglossus kowalevskii TaxID=10224 RepID=A0ABM0GPS1_SACKO|nr:PREDICTED: transmembrane protein 114-like [Saccoglossus kowalevskii]